MVNIKSVSDWLHRILDIVPTPERLPKEASSAYIASAVFSAYNVSDPGHADVEHWREAAVVLTAQSGDPQLQARTLYWATFSAAMREETAAVERYVQRLQSLASRPGNTPTVGVFASLVEAYLGVYHANWEAVLAAVEKGLRQAAQSDVHFLDAMLAGNGVVAAIFSVHTDLMEKYAGQLSARLELQGPVDRSFTEWALGLAACARGEYQPALEHAQHAVQITESVRMAPPLLFNRNLVIQVLCTMGRFAEAWDLLLKNESLSELAGCQFLTHEHSLLKCYVLSVSGRHTEAVTELGDVLNQWGRNTLLRLYSLQRPVIHHLGMLALEIGFDPVAIKTAFDHFSLEPSGESRALDAWPWPLKIYTLGRFSVVRDGVPMDFTGKAQIKPLELLKALIAYGGRSVAQERLAEALWPDSEGDAAMRACSTTLYRLRKLLGNERLITVGDNSITLDARYCWVDSWAFERAVSEGRAGSTESLQWALSLYKGHFLENATNAPWMLRIRERLRSHYVAVVRDTTRRLCDKGQCGEACQVAEQGLSIDDLVEDFYVALMSCHRCIGQHGEALDAYNRCARRLQDKLGVMPSPRTRELHRKILDEVGGAV